jgi:hypothetical protein
MISRRKPGPTYKVSGRNKNMIMKNAPAKIAINQRDHLHPLASMRTPVSIGEINGPD